MTFITNVLEMKQKAAEAEIKRHEKLAEEKRLQEQKQLADELAEYKRQ